MTTWGAPAKIVLGDERRIMRRGGTSKPPLSDAPWTGRPLQKRGPDTNGGR